MIPRLLFIAAIITAAALLLLRSCADGPVEEPLPISVPDAQVQNHLAPAEPVPVDSAGERAERERLEADRPSLEAQAPPASIAGTVINLDGRPMAGVVVALFGQDSGENPLQQVTSGDDGAFEVLGLADGSYWLAAAGADAIQTNAAVQDGESVRGVCVITYGLKTLTGHLTDRVGAPVAGATIYLDVQGDSESAYLRWTSRLGSTLSDENGAFRFDDVPRLPVRLGVYPQEHATVAVEVAPDLESVSATVGGIEEDVVVIGRVLDPGGAPVAGARVEEKSLNRSAKGVTDEAGRFSLETAISGMPGARRFAAVEAWSVGFAPVRVEFPVLDGRAGPVDITLREAHALVGQVVDASGQPIGASLTLFEAGQTLDDPSLIRLLDARFQRATAEGGFRVEHLWEGEFDVVVQVGKGTHSIHRLNTREGPFILSPNSENLEIAFEVTARNAITKQRLTSFSLGTYRKRGGGSKGGIWKDGVARDSEKGPADLEIRVKANGYANAKIPRRHFEPGTYRIALPLLPVRSVRLRAVDAAGLPVRGLYIRLPEIALTVGELAAVTPASGGTTEIDGRCWLDNVPVTIKTLDIYDASGEVLLSTLQLETTTVTGPPEEQTVVIGPH